MDECRHCCVDQVSRIPALFDTVEVTRKYYPGRKKRTFSEEIHVSDYIGRPRLRVSEWFNASDDKLSKIKEKLHVGNGMFS